MEHDHYVTREEYERLLALAQPRKGMGCLDTILWLSVGFAVMSAAVFLAMQLGWTPPLLLGPGVNSVQGQEARPTPQAPARTQPPAPGGSGYTTRSAPIVVSGDPLPNCSSVADTTTACVRDTAQQQPAEVTTKTLDLAPPAIECYKGSFYTCEELAEMGDNQAVDAVKSTDAFLDTSAIATPEPGFVDYATQACAQAAVKSPLCP